MWHAHLQALDFAASMRELGADATVEVVSSIDELPSGHAKASEASASADG